MTNCGAAPISPSSPKRDVWGPTWKERRGGAPTPQSSCARTAAGDYPTATGGRFSDCWLTPASAARKVLDSCRGSGFVPQAASPRRQRSLFHQKIPQRLDSRRLGVGGAAEEIIAERRAHADFERGDEAAGGEVVGGDRERSERDALALRGGADRHRHLVEIDAARRLDLPRARRLQPIGPGRPGRMVRVPFQMQQRVVHEVARLAERMFAGGDLGGADRKHLLLEQPRRREALK